MDESAGLPGDARKLAIDRFRLLQPHTLVEMKRGETAEKEDAPPAPADKPAKQSAPALKRYRNE